MTGSRRRGRGRRSPGRTASPTIRNLEREKYRLEQRARTLASHKATSLVMKEREGDRRQTYVHLRGDFLAKGKEVSPGVPAFLPPLPPPEQPEATNQLADRLALAKWLVDPENPLTARVTVNRFWERCFGAGLVQTSVQLISRAQRAAAPRRSRRRPRRGRDGPPRAPCVPSASEARRPRAHS